ncbi:GntR family transcriptional regulator [Timonella sp. A28]|uniref:GntR family transcriptional regulator n=1 Tax=Timonella sp. A28 TaxID=3442640 RepID=UPI003EBDA3D2
MPIEFSIDHTAKIPPFEQIKHTIIEAIDRQETRADEKLPAIRSLAKQLGVAVNTVARSYRELEDEGYVTTQGRSGTRINPQAIPADIALMQYAHAYIKNAVACGATKDAALTAIEHHWPHNTTPG